ncbi:ABC transporter ATP-binding protein [Olsenella uli]|uniref:ABC transporter ATP-binding protein n=1 Tax=Olsenella uli TaxID=133926 RepID=UPI00241D6163|nr:ABC transporter ATP-binding protein [Olsenella uli]
MRERKANPVALVFRWAGRHRKYLVASVVCATLSGLMAAVPYLAVFDVMRTVYEGTVTAQTIAADVSILAAGIVVRFVLFALAGTLSHKGAYGALFDVRCRILERLSKAPLGEMDERNTGKIKTVLSDDVENLELLLAHNLPEAFMYGAGPVAIFAFLLFANVPLALATLIPAFAALAVLVSLFKVMSSIMGRANESLEGMNSVMAEYVSGMRTVRALDMGTRSFRRFRKAVDEENAVWCEISRKTGPGFASYVIIIEAGLLIMVPAGALMLMNGAIDGATYLLFAFVGSLYLTEIRLLQSFANKLSQVSASAERVQELLGIPVFGGGVPFPDDASIRLDGVSFSYADDAPEVLHDVSLNVAAGERIAIVGASGSGKSTLIQLIGRFYDVTSGSVSIGGIDVRRIDYDDLLAHVSAVFQKTFLASGTILENIRMGSDATLDEVRAAARRAQADDFIQALPQGYDTRMGTLGGRLSGGERQRIAIARAILKDAPILILDEATSAADPENQVLIDRAIDNLCEGKTVLVVAHRLDAVDGCDAVAVMEDGRITCMGPHNAALEASSYYRSAWAAWTRSRSMSYRIGEKEGRHVR